MDFSNIYVYVNGAFQKGEDAKISVYDRGLFFGDGVFEGIRAYDGKIFKIDEHLNRLFDSAHAILINPPDREILKKAVIDTVKKNKLKNCHIRLMITRGEHRTEFPGITPKGLVGPTVVIQALPAPPLLGSSPLRLKTSAVRRFPPQVIDAKIKSLNYLNNVLAKLEANSAGFDEALMLDLNGFLAEACAENIFIVKNNKIYTPHTRACLAGITRATVIDLARDLGYEVIEKDLTLLEAYTADEVFLVGTGAEIVLVCEIDGRKVSNISPITMKIKDAYFKLIKEKYLTPVYEE